MRFKPVYFGFADCAIGKFDGGCALHLPPVPLASSEVVGSWQRSRLGVLQRVFDRELFGVGSSEQMSIARDENRGIQILCLKRIAGYQSRC